MSATVDCPYCTTTVPLLDFQIGQKLVCPSCQQTFLAEAPVKPAGPSSRLQDVAEAELERPDRRRTGSVKKAAGYKYPDRGLLILIVGIFSIVCGLLGCLPLFIVPFTAPLVLVSFLVAVPTVALGFLFMHQIDTGKRDPAGKGMNVAGLLCGVLSLVLFFLVVLIFCVFVGLAPGARRRRADVPMEHRSWHTLECGGSTPLWMGVEIPKSKAGVEPPHSKGKHERLPDRRWFFAVIGYNASGRAALMGLITAHVKG